jgi:hypothetical protein
MQPNIFITQQRIQFILYTLDVVDYDVTNINSLLLGNFDFRFN